MKARRVLLGCGVLGLAALGYAAWRFGPAAIDLYRAGFFSGQQKHAYQGDTLDNLRALHTALMLYHDSEGQFPIAEGWMDAVEPRLRTADLEPDEAAKKLVRPGVQDGQGYAMNDAASGKYKDDVEPKVPLVFESRATGRNAHGDPAKDRLPGGKAIATDGSLLQ